MPCILIDVMVRLVRPQVGELRNDLARGTFGFMIATDRYLGDQTDDYFDLDENQAVFQKQRAFTGCELVHDTCRLALMNAMLYGIEGEILLADMLFTAGKAMKGHDLVPTNPPLGTKKNGERAIRNDSAFAISNRQLSFLQHIYYSLKCGGWAVVVLPDNVLSADGDSDHIRADLMNKCTLHMVLRLLMSIFYAQGVRTNALSFTRGQDDRGNTKEVWFYDLRTNIPSFGRTTPPKKEHFANFEAVFEVEDRHAVRDERWGAFSREEIETKGDSLDLGPIRDKFPLDYDDLSDPIENGGACIT